RLDAGTQSGAVHHDLEDLNRVLIRIKDAAWSIGSDRLRAATEIVELAGRTPSPAAIRAYWAIQQSLSALDRLEVRGRDSAGIQVAVTGHGLDLNSPAVAHLIERRSSDLLFTSGAVRAGDDTLTFVYKAAAEIGELGDNTRALRAEVTADEL